MVRLIQRAYFSWARHQNEAPIHSGSVIAIESMWWANMMGLKPQQLHGVAHCVVALEVLLSSAAQLRYAALYQYPIPAKKLLELAWHGMVLTSCLRRKSRGARAFRRLYDEMLVAMKTLEKQKTVLFLKIKQKSECLEPISQELEKAIVQWLVDENEGNEVSAAHTIIRHLPEF